MSRWDYRNIGASAKPENKKLVEKIFEYIGYAKGPDLSEDGDGPSFSEPDVYGCWYSANSFLSGKVRDCFDNFYEYDLLFLLNALFPKTNVYVHSAEGNNTSDTWETHDVVFDTGDMTCYRNDSYTDYGGSGPSGNRSSKERFILRPPELEFISALIKISKEDGNTELTDLLLDLESKVKDGLIVYEDDGTDQRKNGQQYDVVDEVVDNTEDEEDIDDAYFDYVIGRMPYTVFNDLYRVKSSDSNSFDEEDYKLILGDLLEYLDTEFRPFDMIYGDFVDWLKDNECVTALNEEEYKKAREKAEKLDIVSLDEFRLQRFGGNAEEEEDEEAYEDDEEDYSDEDDDRDEEESVPEIPKGITGIGKMGFWYGTKLGFRVDPSEKVLASQFLKVLGADENGKMAEKIGELSGGSYECTVCGAFEDDTLEIENVLDRIFNEYKSGESEEDEDEDDYTLDDIWYVANKLFCNPIMYLMHEDGNSNGNISDDVYYRYEAIYGPDKKEVLNCYCEMHYYASDTDIEDLKRRRTDRHTEKSKVKRPDSGLIKLLTEWAEKEGLDELAQKLKEKPAKKAAVKEDKADNVAGLKISGDAVVGYSGNEDQLEIPEGIKTIGDFAVSARSKLVKVRLPESLERIGMGAFNQCKKLEQIEIPEKVTFIGEAAFNECKSLKEIRIPEKTVDIENAVFINCEGLQRVIFPTALKSIGSNAFFGCKKLTELVLPSNLKELGSRAFAGCVGLKKAVVPKTLEQVVNDNKVFEGCKKLTDIQYI